MNVSAEAFDSLYSWWCENEAVEEWAAAAFVLPIQQTSHTDKAELNRLADAAGLSSHSHVLSLAAAQVARGSVLSMRRWEH